MLLPGFIQIGIEEEVIGWLDERRCTNCHTVNQFSSIASYGYFRVFFVFGVAGLTTYDAACHGCGYRWRIEKKEADSLRHAGKLAPPDIPPLTQYGWVGLLVIIGVLWLLAVYGSLVIVTVGMMVAAALIAVVVKGVRRRGVKGYTQELREGERPLSLFESVGGLAPKGRSTWWKCSECGLNNTANATICERCSSPKL